jgi:5-methylthioadenosine/S-adenosylhomocysteine deaminase
VHGVDERAVRAKARLLAAAAVKRAGLHAEEVETTTTLYDEGN